MAKKYFMKKRKQLQTKLRHNTMFILLPLYIAFIILLGAICLVITCCFIEKNAPLVYGVLISAAVLYFAVSFCILFVIIPAMRAKQAEEDIKCYDFSPYTPTDDEEFLNTVATEKYYFSASPFDEDEVTSVDGEKALHDYFEQFTPDRFLGIEYLGKAGEFTPFFIFDFTAADNLNRTLTKKVEGDVVSVTIAINYKLSFCADGIKTVGKTYPYSELQASANAMFTGFATSARIFLLCSDALLASFAFGGRIISLLDKYNIPVENKDVLDFILADPLKAFKRTARHRKLKLSNKKSAT